MYFMKDYHHCAAVKLPSIKTEPAEKKYIEPQVNVTFSLEAEGSELTYEWKKSNGVLPAAPRCTGATSKILTIYSVRPEDAGRYYCHVSNPCGFVESKRVKLSLSE